MSKLADDLERLCCAETEGKFFDLVTDSITEIIAALRKVDAETDAIAPGNINLVSGAASDPLIDTEQSGHGLSPLQQSLIAAERRATSYDRSMIPTTEVLEMLERIGEVSESTPRAGFADREALKVVREIIRGEQIEFAVIDANTMQPLGAFIDAVLSDPAQPETGVRATFEAINTELDKIWDTSERAEEIDGLVKLKNIVRRALSTDEAGGVQGSEWRTDFENAWDGREVQITDGKAVYAAYWGLADKSFGAGATKKFPWTILDRTNGVNHLRDGWPTHWKPLDAPTPPINASQPKPRSPLMEADVPARREEYSEQRFGHDHD